MLPLHAQPPRLHACMCHAQDLEYVVKDSARWRVKLRLLSRVSGSLYPGELAALVRLYLF